MPENDHTPQPTTSAPDPTRVERALVPLVTFAIVTGVVSVALDILQDLTGILDGWIALAALGPAAGALAVATLQRRRIAGLMPAAVSTRQVVAHLILGVIASALFLGLLVAGLALIDTTPVWGYSVGDVPAAGLAVGILVSVLLQEIGWRGTLQPLLETIGNRMLASVLVSLLWGFWLVQMFPTDGTALGVFAIVLAAVPASVLLGHFGNGSPTQRVLASTIVHALLATAVLLVTGGGALLGLHAVIVLAALTVTAVIFMAMFYTAQRKRARRRAAEQHA